MQLAISSWRGAQLLFSDSVPKKKWLVTRVTCTPFRFSTACLFSRTYHMPATPLFATGIEMRE